MSNIRYSVERENHPHNLVSHFKYLMQMQILVDTTLACDSNMLKVHKVVLAATSLYFQDILKDRPGEHVFKLKMSFDVLKHIVEFIYSGKTNFLDVHKSELLSAARFLKIRGLMELVLDYAGPLPEFIAPIIITQPVNIKQENLQMTIRDDLLDSLLVNCSQNNKNNSSVVVHIPIEIENSDYRALGKRRHTSLNKCLFDDGDGFSYTREELKSINEKKLLKLVSQKLKNVEECSIETIRKLKTLQDKQVSIEQLEISEAVSNVLHLESHSDSRQNNITNFEINKIDRTDSLHPFYAGNNSLRMLEQDSIIQNTIRKENMLSRCDSILNSEISSVNVPNFSTSHQMASISANDDLMDNILTLSSENCFNHNNKSGIHILNDIKNSRHKVKRRRDKFNKQSLNDHEHSTPAQDIDVSISQLEHSEAVDSIVDEKFHENRLGYKTVFQLSNARKGENLEDTLFHDQNKSETIVYRDYATCDEEVSIASQCEHVLKSAGLPTDVPILYKSQDGSYLNLTGETLIDMVQNNNIKFEVIEHKDLIDGKEINENYSFAD